MQNQQLNAENLQISKYQKFETVTIPRSELKSAPYNPRKIDDESRKKLKKSIKNFGLVDTVIWNVRSGNIVGGHQRLNQLDALEKNQDYLLTVAKIDVDEKTEKELNIALNNPNLQGDYDLSLLADLLKDSASFDNSGFSQRDLELMFDDKQLAGILSSENESEPAKKSIEEIQKLKDIRKKSKENLQKKDTDEYFLIAVFQNCEQQREFARRLNLGENRYIDGNILADKLGILPPSLDVVKD